MPTILVAIAACGRLDFDPLADARGGAGDAGGLADASFSGSSDTYIKSSNSEAGDAFGGALALSGDGLTLAVGAAAEDSAATGIDGNQADNSAMSSGAVYVFTRAGTTWTQQAYVKASNTDANDVFGGSVALSLKSSSRKGPASPTRRARSPAYRAAEVPRRISGRRVTGEKQNQRCPHEPS